MLVDVRNIYRVIVGVCRALAIFQSPVAQLVERRPVKAWVLGSSPSWGAII